MTTRRRRPDPTALDFLSLRVEPETVKGIDALAHRLGVKRSALARWGLEYALKSVRWHSRHWLIKQLERSEAERELKVERRGLTLVAGGQDATGLPAEEA